MTSPDEVHEIDIKSCIICMDENNSVLENIHVMYAIKIHGIVVKIVYLNLINVLYVELI